MNKTVNMNLGGLFFHIDEKAYLKLKHYLDAVSRALNDDPQGKEEIIADIEQRIGELLSKKITDERQVINEKNIDEVISIMGQPEDYGFDEELFDEPNTKRTKQKRKMYRDGIDKILGGVSSGLGYYFGIDASWIRIIWILTTLLGGSGVLIYLVLWIILPEALSTADQLQMKGEPVNINNIERKIKEEYAKIENKVKNTDYSHVKSGFQDIIDMLGKLLGGSLKVIGKFIGILLLVIASIVLISGLFGLLSWGSFELLNIGNKHLVLPPFMEGSIVPKELSVIFLILSGTIPFVFLFILGLNILSKDKKIMGTTANLSLLGIWLVSLFGMAFTGIEFKSRYASKSTTTLNHEFTINPKDTLRIVMRVDNKISNRENLFRKNSNIEFVTDSLGNKKIYASNIQVDVRKNDGEKIMIKVLKSSRAYNQELAAKKAESIEYYYNLDAQKNLNLNAYFLAATDLNKNSPKIKVIIYVPENRYVYFDSTTKHFLYRIKNKQDIYDSKMIKHYFRMTKNDFECTDCLIEKDKDSRQTKEGVNLKIDENGVNFSVKDGKEAVKVKIDSDGIEIR